MESSPQRMNPEGVWSQSRACHRSTRVWVASSPAGCRRRAASTSPISGCMPVPMREAAGAPRTAPVQPSEQSRTDTSGRLGNVDLRLCTSADQSGRPALDYGSRGCRFESCRAHTKSPAHRPAARSPGRRAAGSQQRWQQVGRSWFAGIRPARPVLGEQGRRYGMPWTGIWSIGWSCLPGREAPTAATTSVSASRSSSNGRSLCSVSASVTRRSARYPAPPSSVPRNRCMGT
jgi:hypothetical protein